jgi:hypothetical protein
MKGTRYEIVLSKGNDERRSYHTVVPEGAEPKAVFLAMLEWREEFGCEGAPPRVVSIREMQ